MHQIGITAQVCASGQWWLNHLVWTTRLCLPLSKLWFTLLHTEVNRLTHSWHSCLSQSSPCIWTQSFQLITPQPEFQSHFLPSVSFKHAGGIERIFRLVAAFLKMNGVGWSCSLPYLADWSWVTDGLYPVSSAHSSCVTPEVLCAAIDKSCWDYHIQEESRLGGVEQVRKSLWNTTKTSSPLPGDWGTLRMLI